MNRRQFLTMAGGGLLGPREVFGLDGSGSAFRKPKIETSKPIDPHDEGFWSMIREHFPLTRERIYLNTGGLGASPYVSIAALKNKIDELERISETGHRHELWFALKQRAAKIFGCKPEEIAYTRNTTEGVNIVCNGFPFRRGDEVITSTHEHVGNTIAWLARQRRDGIRIRVFEPLLASARENLHRIERLISKKTRAISIAHVTTATGQILPVREIGVLARAHDLWYFIDGAQSAGMLPLDVHEIGCHAYATSGHKWLLGPKGTGLLYVREDCLDLIEAKWVGAYSNQGRFDMGSGEFHFHPTAQRYEYGTVSVPLFVGLGAAITFLQKIGIENIWRRDHAMANTLKEELNRIGARVLSPQHPAEHSAMITFKIKNMDYQRLQKFLAEKFHMRTRGVYEGGLNGVRISLHLYNSFADVEQIVDAVKIAQKM